MVQNAVLATSILLNSIFLHKNKNYPQRSQKGQSIQDKFDNCAVFDIFPSKGRTNIFENPVYYHAMSRGEGQASIISIVTDWDRN